MATSLNPITEKTDGGAKKYLDYSGLNKLWDNICDKFAPKWKTVNFNTLTQPTHAATKVSLPFTNISVEPNANGVIDHTQANQYTIEFLGATQDAAGVMSAADKLKLDNLEISTENSIPLKQVKVGNTLTGGTYPATALKINTTGGSKDVSFGLSYDANTDQLSIIDLNSSNKVLSSVHVLGDAIKTLNGFSDVDVITENGNTYLTFTLTVTDQDGNTQAKSVKVNVNDLVSVYTAGNGISLSVKDDATNDDKETSVTINVIPPKYKSNKNTIGGVIPKKVYTGTVASWDVASGTTAPTVQALGTQTGRYFGVETDTLGHAFVNVPAATITRGTDSVKKSTHENNSANATFRAMTGLSWSLSADGKTYTWVPEFTDFTHTKETKLSKIYASATSELNQADIVLNGNTAQTINYISGIDVSDHAITVNKDAFTIKETELSFDTDASSEITLVPGTTSSVTPLTGITNTAHHKLKRTFTAVKVADPASIELTYIQGLTYAVPTTA